MPDEGVGIAERLEPGAREDGCIALFELLAGEVAIAGEVLQRGGAGPEPEQPPGRLPAVAAQVGGELGDRPMRWSRLKQTSLGWRIVAGRNDRVMEPKSTCG